MCTEVLGNMDESSDNPISSTEERVKEGEKLNKRIKENRIKKCPYAGCSKEYKGKSLVGYKKHVKTCSYRNQQELGLWVMKNSRKYDYDLVEDQKEFLNSSDSDN